jgi:CRISPR-associated protein Cas2
MSENGNDFSGYKGMWLFAMFDLPVDGKEKRRDYTRFRKGLLQQGFSMLQYSVYARYFSSQEAGESHMRRLRLSLPPEGEVRIMMVTDKQFGKMEVYYGKKRKKAEEAPSQLMLF